MRHFEVHSDIDASQASVWAALVDFPSYKKWNPIIPYFKGTLKAGETIRAKFRTSDTYTKAYVEGVIPGEKFIMSRSLYHPLLLHMVHDFEVQSLTASKARLIHRWHCRGFLIPFVWQKLTAKMQTFDRFNEGLKTYIEAA